MEKFSKKIGTIPNDWDFVNAKDCLILESGMRPKEHVTDIDTDIPSLGGENIDENGFLTFENVRYISPTYYGKMKKGHIKDEDIYINKDGANTGKIAFSKKKPFAECAVNEHVFIIRNNGTFIQQYLFYCLLANFGKQQILKKIIGSAQEGINNSFTKGIILPKPSLPEQTAIANILSKVDEAIESVKKSIAAAERLKKSMMQNLLTGKMKADGTFRTEEEFYDDPKFGKVPVGWEVKKVKELSDFVQYGLNQASSENSEIPMLRMNNILKGKMTDFPLVYVDLNDTLLNQYKLAKGDILFNRTNSMDLVGKVGIFELEGDFVFASYLIRVKVSPVNNSSYVNYALNSYPIQCSLRSKATPSVSQANINSNSLRNTSILIPINKDEQDMIVSIISKIEEQINNKQNQIITLERLKKSLMQNLLTGKVRVGEGKHLNIKTYDR